MATKKMGRPTEAKKDFMLRVRLDNTILEKLQFIESNTNKSKSEIVRNGIELQYIELKNK